MLAVAGRHMRWLRVWGVFCLFLFLGAPGLRAENQLGGHFGFVLPLVTRTGDETTSISDDFAIGFPMGITVKKNDKVAFDLELVPAIQNDPLKANLTVHPGVVWSLPHRFGVGVRLAFDINQSSWGFTPLVNRSYALSSGTAFFWEFVLPIRIQSDPKKPRENTGSVTFGIHLGVGF